ncbi:DNA damage-regulated autophagy modulator protein 1 isoform X1 [Microcaecilia unicolor]|uniref:DNA damage-regulated autophagy modulator protein 1 isoform X1 n=1 Tax=Microcaecilia unicolor TaxID=1415580 RepID=A0A6P7Z599_9AMPH|nr:DNA damage-regulated autophagy modulator protein 1 isoform X1 [Microcaecilia unicolor]
MSVCLSLPQRSACCAPCRSDMARPLQGTAFIPSLLVVWSSTAFILSYVIAVLSGHVNPLVPYISDTGTNPPESGVFGFMISITAFLGAVTMYAKYKILEKQNEVSRFMNPLSNVASLTTGLMGCTGMGIVATFQELAVPIVHDVGALMTFICGVLYILSQSALSYKSAPVWNTQNMCHVRLAISSMSFVALVPMIICAILASMTKLIWDPDEKDYAVHLTSAICEWIVAFAFICFFLTYIRDFQGVTLTVSTEILDDFR